MKYMLNLKLILVFLITSLLLNQSVLLAQTPSTGIFFQAIARDQFANPAKDRKIFVQSSIVQTSATGTRVLIETHQTTTDGSGVFSISVGQGTRTGGTVANLDRVEWAKGPYYLNLKIAITPMAPIPNWDYTKDWIDLGTSPFGTVPYALYSGSSGALDDKLSIADTAKMLAIYAKAQVVNNLSSQVNTKLSANDTATMLAPYAKMVNEIVASNITSLTAASVNAALESKVNVKDSGSVYVTPLQLKGVTFDTTSLITKIDKKINLADSTTVFVTPLQLAAKTFDSTAIYTQLGTKLNKTDTSTLSNRINLKANTTDLTSGLALKFNKTDTSLLLQKADTSTLSNRINLKSNTTDLTSGLALKFNKIDTSFLLQKADTATLSNRINLKANTTDVNSGLALKLDASQKGVASGVASLDLNAKVPASQIPVVSFQSANVVATEAAMLGLSSAVVGSIAIRTDNNRNYVLSGSSPALIGNWVELAVPTSVTTINGFPGAHVTLTTNDIGEGTNNKYYTDARARNVISVSGPLNYNASTGTLSITAASGSSNGYLSSSDFTTFNNKQNTLVAGTDYATPSGNITGNAANVTGVVSIVNGGTGTSTATGALTTLGAEARSNKSTATDLGNTSPSDLLYPSQKAVKTYVDLQSANAGVADLSITNAKLAGSIAANKLIGTDITTVGTITSGVWSGTEIAIAKGGTGATTAADARTNLGLIIGTNVMAANAITTLTGDVTGSGNGSFATTVNSVGGITAATIAGLPTSVSANTSSITAETTRATNAENALDTRVTSNTSSITVETTRATNAESGLDTRITSNTSSITAETTRATNAESALDTRVTSNTSSITAETTRATNAEAGLDTRINANTASITSNTSAINANTASITINTSEIASNTASITSNTTAISANTASITSNTTSISANTASITSNTIAISANTASITSNTTSISANTASITSNTSEIASNTASITSNTSSIAANTASITAETTRATNAENGLDTRITSNTTSITANTNAINTKQTALTPGSGISISGGTISVTGLTTSNLANNANIANTQLANSTTTLGSTTMTLGGTITSVTGLTSVSSTGLTGALTGNASTASALATGRTIALTGDLDYTSGAFDGTGNVTGSATLTNTTVTAGDYGSSTAIPTFTVDSKGRLTAAGTVGITAGVSSLNFTTSSSYAAGGTISGTSLTLTAADATNPGLVSTGSQTIAGAKTFNNDITAPNFIGNLNGNANTANTVNNSITFNTSGSGDISGASFNGGNAKTISYNTIGAAPAAGSSNITTVGTISSGTWNGNTIPVGYGGTGVTSITGLIKGGGTSPFTAATAGMDYQAPLTASSGIAISGGMISASGITSLQLASNANILPSQISNSKVTIGTTEVSLGNSTLTLDGLNTVTSSSFVGTLSGTASNVSGTVAVANGGTGLTAVGTNGQVLKSNGTSIAWANDAGIQSLNGLTATNQTFTTSTAGSTFTITSNTGNHEINIPVASLVGVAGGLISNTEFNSFSNKQVAFTNLSTLGTLPNSGGFLKNDGGGTFSYASPNKTDVGLALVENIAIGTWTGSTNLTTVGTISNGTWAGSVIADNKITTALTGKTYNGLTLTSAANGFTIAGGTSSKTLTVASDANVSGTNTGDQTITLTGDVTGTGTGTFTSTLANTTVTVGSYGSSTAIPTFTVDAKGRLTAAGTTSIIADAGTLSGTITAAGKVANSATTATNANTANAIVARDASGNFTAGTITGTLSGTATNISGVVAIANGGTGLTSVGTNGQVLSSNGTSIAWSNPAATGITSINGITSGTQTLTVGTAGTAPAFNSASSTHTLNIPMASESSVTAGLLSKTQYDVFNAKQTALTAGSGISISGGTISATGLTTSNLSSTAGITNAQLASSTTILGSTTMSLGGTVTSVAGLTSVSSTGFTGALTGNASTATTLATARNINGTAFNGSADITIIADAGTLSGTTLKSTVTSSSLTGVGTITSGTWNGTTIAVANGGTGVTTSTGSGSVVLSSGPTLVTPILGAATGTSLSITGTLSAGTSSVTSSTVSGNETVGGTLGVTGATTLTSLTASGNSTLTTLTTTTAATFSGTVTIPSGAGLNRVLTSDASGNATWNANPNSPFKIVTDATYTVSATEDKYILYTRASLGTISLPAITSTMSGKEIIIKNISNFNVTIIANGTQKIVADFATNALTSATLGVEASNNWIKLIADGTNSQWVVFRALF